MSFWSSQSLRSRLPGLINPFDPNRIDSASYELCLGEEVYISSFPNTPQKDRKKVFLKERETVAIPPGQFAFLRTAEEISVPIDAIAFISIKFGAKAKGIINVSGFHVDPGYKGRLVFAVFNAGPLNCHVECGQRLFSIWFANLDEADEHPRKKPGFVSIPTDLINSPDLVASLPYLVERLDNIDKKVENYSTRQAIIWAILIPISLSIVLSFVKPLTDRFISPLFDSNNSKPTLVKPSPSNQPLSPQSQPK
jgi:dCTP deaminase